MKLEREILLSNLLQLGVTEACGKPVEEASLSELQQEWANVQSKKENPPEKKV